MRLSLSLLWLAVTGLALLVVASASGPRIVNSVGKVLPPDAARLSQQIYRFMGDEPTSLDVSVNLYVGGWNEFLFERLLATDENGKLIPAAAARWTVSPDGKTWTFDLRKQAKWSDGRPVTARDFEYSYRRFLAPETANPYASFYYDIKGARAYNQGKMNDPRLLGVRATDDYTLVIEVEHPAPYLGLIAAFPTSHPVPRWQVEKYGQKWTEAENCVTNSSYALVEWKHGDRMVFVLDRNYNGPVKGSVERIIRTFQHPSSANLLPYENDEVGRVAVQANELSRVLNNPVLKSQLVSSPADGTWYLFFQTRKPPFNRLKVRQAISHAIDRESICRVMLRRAGRPAYSMLTPTFDAYADYRQVQAFNPALAKQMLAEAGYPGGRGFPVVELWLREAAPETKLVAEAIQGMLKDHLGIRLTIRSADYPVFTDQMFNWKIPMGFVPFYADYRDPKNMLDMIWHPREAGTGRHDWMHAEFARLLDRADAEPNAAARTALYRQAERILVSDVGGVFVYHPIAYELYKPWLKGVKKNKFGGYSFIMTDVYIGTR
ncbi:MAG: peptide ABC transporter substrate-binding protein [Candidatus Latescibacteria bacterium]|nr:peptide ABC transporter substrate-binding protein [Candidatus Latescibacterota bacterium]